MLPPFLAQFVDAWKRPTQMSSSGPMPVMALRELTEQEAAEAAAKGGGAKGGKGGAPADGAPAMRDMAPGAAMAAGHESNEWLLYSMLNVYKSRSQVAPHDFLWENIWPKGPDGKPCPRYIIHTLWRWAVRSTTVSRLAYARQTTFTPTRGRALRPRFARESPLAVRSD
jgi:hypothetical protein